MSDENIIIDSKVPSEEEHLQKQLTSLIRSRTSYVGKITKIINKITRLISDEEDSETLHEIELYNGKLDNYINSVRSITSKYFELQPIESKNSDALNYCTDQEFRIIQIKKSINTYNSHCNSNRGNQLVKSPSNVIVDIHSRTSSHHSSKSYKSGNSSANSASYLAVIEKRKSTECAKALAVQAEERAKRTITLLEKKKALELEMEKESVANEVIEARNKASIAEIELRYEEEACQTNNLSGYARSSISKQNRKLEKPFQEKIQKSVTIGDAGFFSVNGAMAH